MAYGSLLSDVVQSSTAGTPPQFNDGNGTQVGTLCRAWVAYNGSTQTKNGSFNVSSVTRSAAGQYVINFTNAMPDANYCASFGFQPDGLYFSGSAGTRVMNIAAQAAGNCTIYSGAQYPGGGGTYIDFNIVNVSIFR